MITIRHVLESDQEAWFKLDKHLSKAAFLTKVRDKQGFVLYENGVLVGILRYQFFWDEIPFCTLLYIDPSYQRKHYGTKLLRHFENEMALQGYPLVLTSTQADEQAQHFYRALGYEDCGCLILPTQATELFLKKSPKAFNLEMDLN